MPEAKKVKGHWPAGKRRHSEPPDWDRVRAALAECAKRRQSRLLAKKVEVHVDTLRRWRLGIDVPDPTYARRLIAGLYALKLYWIRTGRKERP